MEADGSWEDARSENTEQTLSHKGVTETLVSFASNGVYSLDSQNNGIAGDVPGESERGEVKGNIGGDEPLIGAAGEDYSKLYKLLIIGAKWYSCC